MKRKKAIILDLDGTVINSPKQKLPSPRLVKTISRLTQAGYYVSAATGRVWSFAHPVLVKMQLVDPSIISGGTQIVDSKTGKVLWQKTIDSVALKKVIEVFKRYPKWKLLFNDYQESDYLKNKGVLPKEFKTKESVYFLEQVFIPEETARQIHKELSTIDGIASILVVSQKKGLKDIHVVNSQATKENAIHHLLNILGVKKEDTIGVGDGHNDLHLFNAVGMKVAMGNAVPELKAAADRVIGSVEDDGLVEFLEELT